MALQASDAVRAAMLNSIEATVGTSAILEIRSGAAPANCAAADSGTVLASMTLPSDWMAAASAGSVGMTGTWEDTSANATGTAGHYRIKNSAGTVCHLQGTVGTSGADLNLNNTSIATGQAVSITSFSISVGGA